MSVLKADTIQSTSGGAATLTKQHAAKTWANINGSTFALRDSFNVGSATDNGTGDYTINLTNSMGNANYCVGVSATDDSSTAGQTDGFAYGSWIRGSNSPGYAAGSMRVQVGYPANNELFDQSHVNISLHGDLA